MFCLCSEIANFKKVEAPLVLQIALAILPTFLSPSCRHSVRPLLDNFVLFCVCFNSRKSWTQRFIRRGDERQGGAGRRRQGSEAGADGGTVGAGPRVRGDECGPRRSVSAGRAAGAPQSGGGARGDAAGDGQVSRGPAVFVARRRYGGAAE